MRPDPMRPDPTEHDAPGKPEQVTRSERGEPAGFLEAIAEGLFEEMERDEDVVLLGEDIGVYGGAFKVTTGFQEWFGRSGCSTRRSASPDSRGQRPARHTWD